MVCGATIVRLGQTTGTPTESTHDTETVGLAPATGVSQTGLSRR